MAKSIKRNDITEIRDVDFSDFRIRHKEISVNGKPLPIRIGDRIRISENDHVWKTVMGITVHEDSRVQYILEWHDPATGNFTSEALTLSELKLLNLNSRRQARRQAGFGQEGDPE